jgi:hypothetical protein
MSEGQFREIEYLITGFEGGMAKLILQQTYSLPVSFLNAPVLTKPSVRLPRSPDPTDGICVLISISSGMAIIKLRWSS